MDFEAACELAGEAILLVRDCGCPRHGRCRPEGLAFPFTATREALAFQSPVCAMRGCEEDLVLDAEITDRPLHQHMAYVARDAEQGARVVIELRPVEPGVWMHGSRVGDDGELLDDHPSGLAEELVAEGAR